jgi:hypothetical protein
MWSLDLALRVARIVQKASVLLALSSAIEYLFQVTHWKPYLFKTSTLPTKQHTMKFTANFLAVALTLGLTTATLSPASSNTKGAYPKSPSCSPAKTSKAIQAAECSHNTRTSKTQTFAVFKVDHQYDANHGAPYGTCEAYTCAAPTSGQMSEDSDYWTFFWGGEGESKGEGAGCIKDPKTGVCGCENSNGQFISGSSSCK